MLAGVAMWQASVAEAAILGVVAIFALTPAPAYYWILAMVVPLRGGRCAGPAAVGRCAAHASPALSRIGSHAVAIRDAGLGLAMIFAAWVVPDVLAVLRGRRAPDAGEATPG